jgi:adenylate kinase family enzyme
MNKIKTDVQLPEELWKKWDYIKAHQEAIRQQMEMLTDYLTAAELYRIDVIGETKKFFQSQGLFIEGDSFHFDHAERKCWLETEVK